MSIDVDPEARSRFRSKVAALGVAAFVLVDRFLPGVTLTLVPHETVSRPNPLLDPIQVDIAEPTPIHLRRRGTDFTLTPRAAYDISALVVSRERYWLGAAGALIPWDFALVWGNLVRDPYRGNIDYMQSGRFYNWSTNDGRLDLGTIASHSANVHLIFQNGRVSTALARVRSGDVVRLEGQLVDARGSEGFEWKTSLSRTDTGPGACETMTVRAVTIGGRRFE